MGKKRQDIDIPASDRIAVNTDDLRQMLGCGRNRAVDIGNRANAKIMIGSRPLWNVARIQSYLESVSGC